MNTFLRCLLIVSAVLMMIYMIKKIRQSKLKIEYIVFWILFAFVLVIMGAVPQLFYAISKWIGFQSPISMVLLVVVFVLIMKCFFMTIQISQLENKIDNLTQEIAVERKTKEDETK